jgi:hypothetical protein
MPRFIFHIIVYFFFFSSFTSIANAQGTAVKDLVSTVGDVRHDLDFIRAVTFLQNQGNIVDVQVPDLLPPTNLSFSGADLSIRGILEQIKNQMGFEYSIDGKRILIVDPKLRVSEKDYPLNQIVKNLSVTDVPYDEVLRQISLQSGDTIVTVVPHRYIKKVTLKADDVPVSEVLTEIREKIMSKGWYCYVHKNKLDNKFTVNVNF